MIKHFIITRFNYPEDYPHLRERNMKLALYTATSLQNQLNQNFHWMIQTNREIIDYPEFHELGSKILICRFNKQGKVKDADTEAIKVFLSFYVKPGDKLITTRLDDDDMLLPNYVSDVQLIAKNCDIDTLIDLQGYWLDKRNGANKLYYNTRYRQDRSSPFISLVENIEEGKDIKTVYHIKHADMGKHFNFFGSPNYGWIQVLHRYNQMMNKLKLKDLGKEVTDTSSFITPYQFIIEQLKSE